MLRNILLLLSLLSMTACTSMRAIEPIDQHNLAAQVSAGDHVRLDTRDGQHYELDVTRVDADSLTGRDPSGKSWDVRRQAIAALEVRHVSGWKTAGLIVAIVAAAFVVALKATEHAIDQELNN